MNPTERNHEHETETLEFPRRAGHVPETVAWTDEATMNEWCDRLDTTRDRIEAAIEKVGPMPRAIECYLRSATHQAKRTSAAQRIERSIRQDAAQLNKPVSTLSCGGA